MFISVKLHKYFNLKLKIVRQKYKWFNKLSNYYDKFIEYAIDF